MSLYIDAEIITNKISNPEGRRIGYANIFYKSA